MKSNMLFDSYFYYYFLEIVFLMTLFKKCEDMSSVTTFVYPNLTNISIHEIQQSS